MLDPNACEPGSALPGADHPLTKRSTKSRLADHDATRLREVGHDRLPFAVPSTGGASSCGGGGAHIHHSPVRRRNTRCPDHDILPIP